MMAGERHGEAPAIASRSSNWLPELPRRKLAIGGALLLVIVLAVRVFVPSVDEGFVRFQPDASLFPGAPVANAETLVGIGTPDSWTSGVSSCDYSVEGTSAARVSEWHTVRHDWEENGEAKAWVISEKTVAFGHAREGEKYIEDLRNTYKYCGWKYPLNGGYNTILTDMDGLPEDSFAFVVDASPLNAQRPEDFASSNPDDFDGLGVVMPGRKSGHMMFVTWTGWATDVPRDEFIATANRLYEAANDAPDPRDEWRKDDTSIDFDQLHEFVIDDTTGSELGGGRSKTPPLRLDLCSLDLPQNNVLRPLADDISEDSNGVSNGERQVQFVTARWRKRSRYLEAKDRMHQVITPLCIDTRQHPQALIEPISVPGLPAGATVAFWVNNVYGAVLVDDDRQLMMVVVWQEFDKDLSLFVESVNRAWDQFKADNP